MAITRGKKAEAEMPVSVLVKFEKTTMSLAVAPGMPTEALVKALQHAFRKELKAAYGSVTTEVFAVMMKNEADEEELVMLDVLARMPSIIHAAADGVVHLVVTPDKPKKVAPIDKLFAALAALQLPLFACTLLYLARTFLVRPFLRALYRTGPAYRLGLGTVGFWEGAPLSSICASITGTQDATFWERNRKQCVSIFAQKEEGFLIALETLALLTFYWKYRAEINKKVGDTLLNLYTASCELMLEKMVVGVESAHKTTATAFKTYTDGPAKAASTRVMDAFSGSKQLVLGAALFLLAVLFVFYGPLSPLGL